MKALGGSNPPFSASNSLDLEHEKALLRGSFCLIVQVFVQCPEQSQATQLLLESLGAISKYEAFDMLIQIKIDTSVHTGLRQKSHGKNWAN